MKSTWLLIVGVLLGLYFYQVDEGVRAPIVHTETKAREPAHVPQISLPRPSHSLSALQVDLQVPRSKIGPQTTARPVQSQAPRTAPAHAATAITRRLPPLSRSEDYATQAELEISAALTQSRADTELERLDRLLRLTREQADEIYPILARHSAAYDPSLRIRIGRSETSKPSPLPPAGGRGPRGTPERDPEAKPDDPDSETDPQIEDELEEILTPPQNQLLIDDEFESDLWWSEILDELTNADDSP